LFGESWKISTWSPWENIKLVLSPLLPDILKGTALFEDSQPCPFVKSSRNEIQYGALMEWQWQRKTEKFRGRPFPVPLYLPKSYLNWPGIEPEPPR
jgi:hypothetical protein